MRIMIESKQTGEVSIMEDGIKKRIRGQEIKSQQNLIIHHQRWMSIYKCGRLYEHHKRCKQYAINRIKELQS